MSENKNIENFSTFEDAMKYIITERRNMLEPGKAKSLKGMMKDIVSDNVDADLLISMAEKANITKIIKEENDYQVLYKKCVREIKENCRWQEEQAIEIISGYRFLCADGGEALGKIIDERKEALKNADVNNVQQPNTPQPSTQQPIVQQPNVQPYAPQPNVQQPIVEQPIVEQPIVQQLNAPQPNVQQPNVQQPNVQQPIVHQPNVQPYAPQQNVQQPTNVEGKKRVKKITYCLLAFFLGGAGIHKFYSGKIVWGIIYLVFCWTYIPGIVAFIEFIIALFKKSDSQGYIYI